MNDFSMDDPSIGTNIDADLHTCATACSDDLSLQPPGDARLVENLQAVGGSVDMQVKALAATVTLDIQEKPISHGGVGRCRPTAK
jgi:hypothetical protein